MRQDTPIPTCQVRNLRFREVNGAPAPRHTLMTEPGLERRPQTPVSLIFLPQPLTADR